MNFKEGDFIKAALKEDKDKFSLAYVVECDIENEAYRVNDMYCNYGRNLLGTIWTTLKGSDDIEIEKITKERAFAEMI